MGALIEKDQNIRFSGAGSAHQKDVAKREIQMVIQIICTMLTHYDMYSSHGTTTVELWPIAVDHVVWLYNLIICKDSGLSTYELWCRTSFLPSK